MYKNTLTTVVAIITTFYLGACVSQEPSEADRIAHRYLIVDTHIDVPYRLQRQPADVGEATEDGQFDYPRAKQGGLNAAFMSIYIPASVDADGGAFEFAEQSIDNVEAIATKHPQKFAIATCTADLITHFDNKLISLPMGMENGGPIDSKFSNLEHFYQRGIRYVTLTHSKSNHISDSSYDSNEQWQGLSAFGKKLVPEMNRLGVMIDVSHLSDAAFWQVLALSQTPVIASHSSMRHFTPGFHRNMSDDMVVALASKKGVIQVNFGSSFLHQPARDYGTRRTEAAKAYQLANHLGDDDPALVEFLTDYRDSHPYPYADLADVLDHIDRIVALTSIDAVGIGSDYDGVGDTLPTKLKDVSTYPNLVQGLLDRGYSETEIAKLLGGNTLRLWQQVEDYATSQGTQTRCTSS